MIDVIDVHKTYAQGTRTVDAVRGVTLSLAAGESVALVGPSGCGKSTLLHLCGAMDRPTRGEVRLAGQRLGALGDEALTRIRRTRVGFVFQFFNLLPTLTVAQNIGLPLLLAGRPAGEVDAAARELAGRVGLGDRLGHFPQQLSGGEAQRAAIARAVIHEPAVLIADEPTGSLDSEHGARVMELLVAINAERRTTLLLATHDDQVAGIAGRIVHMRDGQIEDARPA